MKMSVVPDCDRPRERLSKLGPGSLSLQELLAVLLRTGDKNRSVLELAGDLLGEFGSLENLARASFSELCRLGGLKAAKAASVLAALELARRINAETPSGGDVPVTVTEGLKGRLHWWSVMLKDEEREYIIGLFTARDGRVITEERLSWGGLDGASLDIRYLLRKAVRNDAEGLAILHNHPDGQLTPSVEDRLLTDHLRGRLEALGIRFDGHYIVAGGKSSPVV
ncbi:MAG: RadC family protein [Thermovirgaceae bacterium]